MKDIYALSAIRDGNPHVCKYFGGWKEEGLVFIQTERTDQTLGKMLAENVLEKDKIAQLIKDILGTIEYCHTKGLGNLNISQESIFYSNGRFKLNSLETGETNSTVSTLKGMKGLADTKAKDMEDFCKVVFHLFSPGEGESQPKEHVELFQFITELADGKCSLAEFFD